MSLENALAENTAAMKELIVALLATSKQALAIPAGNVANTAEQSKEVKKEPAAKKPQAEPATDSTPASQPEPGSASNDGGETGMPAFTFKDVQAMVTKYAAPSVLEGRARVVAVLQRHGLTKFVEAQVKDQATIDAVGAMLMRTFEGDVPFDPRDAAA